MSRESKSLAASSMLESRPSIEEDIDLQEWAPVGERASEASSLLGSSERFSEVPLDLSELDPGAWTPAHEQMPSIYEQLEYAEIVPDMVRDLATGEVESMDEGATEVLEDFPPPVEQRSLADEEDEAEGKSLREASHVEESIAESSESSRAAKMLKSEARATLFEAARSGLLRPAVEKVSLSEELRMKARETLLGAACKGTLAQAVTILNRRRQQHAALAKMRTILEEAAVDGTLGDALDEVWKPQDAVQHDMVQTLAAASADGSLPAKVEDFEASQIASRAHSEAESESMDRLLLGKMRTVLEEAAHSGTLGGALDEIWGPRTVMQDMMQTLAAASVDDSLPTKLEEFQASRADTESQVNSETLESPLLGKMRGVLEDAACTGRLAEALDKLRNRNLQESVQHEMMQALAAASADGSLVCQIEDSEVLEVLSRAASKAHAYVSSRSASKSQAAVDDATLIPPGSVAESVIEVATEPPPPLMERASSVETEIVEGKSAPPAAEEVLPEIIIPVPCETSVDGSLAGEESVLEGIADPPSLLMERASLVESDIVEGKSAMPASEEELQLKARSSRESLLRLQLKKCCQRSLFQFPVKLVSMEALRVKNPCWKAYRILRLY
eukprot:TRINITY_DN5349_c0_g1_i5.p2 TRINITY_DN5349_c0_g1~~TRINITY_DN5349_c0_g1_i5.p2  ORF type:complete len:618 (+),score=138.16 TRINITY_DN5349_c0_g1_i5:464-2317(+)